MKAVKRPRKPETILRELAWHVGILGAVGDYRDGFHCSAARRCIRELRAALKKGRTR